MRFKRYFYIKKVFNIPEPSVNIFTWENISGIIGIIGFVFSLINILILFVSRKKKFIACFSKYGIRKKYCSEEQDMIIIEYRFDNLSELPIAITRVQLVVKNEYFDSHSMPLVAAETKKSDKNGVYHRNVIDTTLLPISLAPLESKGGFLAFQVYSNALQASEKSLTFRICTNRGKPLQKTFLLNADVQCS